MHRHKQKGLALISAVMLVALVVMSVSLMMAYHRRAIVDVKITLEKDQVHALLSASEEKAKQLLVHELKTNKIILHPLTVSIITEKYTVSGKLYDLQARLNINNVNDPAFLKVWKKLLLVSNPTIGDRNIQLMTEALKDWINENPVKTSDSYYLHKRVPYHSAHQALVDINELLLVHYFNLPIYKTLLNYVSVLPVATRININTAGPVILTSLSDRITPALAEQIIQYREQHRGFHKVAELTTLSFLAEAEIPGNLLTIQSQYYSLDTVINYHQHQYKFNTLIQVKYIDNQYVTLISTRKGY